MAEGRATLAVAVSTVWTAPDAPQSDHRLLVQPVPNLPTWCECADTRQRMDLHGRTLTQAARRTGRRRRGTRRVGERPADLYFFARPGARVHHVGFVTGTPVGPARMLHAPETGGGELLVGAGRLS